MTGFKYIQAQLLFATTVYLFAIIDESEASHSTSEAWNREEVKLIATYN